MLQLIVSFSCAAAIAVSTGVFAQASWNLATPFPDSEFITQNIYQFAKDVEEQTNGELNITVHSGQSLFRQPEILRAVRSSQVEAGEVMMGNLVNKDALFAADILPFLVSGYDEARKLWEAQRPFVAKRLEDEGMKLLFAVPWPTQGFYTNRPIKSMDDMAGISFRTPNALSSEMARLMGASPTTVEAVEIPQAFSTGIVDAMVTSAATGVRMKAWDFSDYYYDVQAYMPKNMVFINQRAFNNLSEEQKAGLIEAAREAETRGWKMSQKEAVSSTKELAEHMPVKSPSDGIHKKLAEIGEKMADEWVKEVGPDGEAILRTLD